MDSRCHSMNNIKPRNQKVTKDTAVLSARKTNRMSTKVSVYQIPLRSRRVIRILSAILVVLIHLVELDHYAGRQVDIDFV